MKRLWKDGNGGKTQHLTEKKLRNSLKIGKLIYLTKDKCTPFIKRFILIFKGVKKYPVWTFYENCGHFPKEKRHRWCLFNRTGRCWMTVRGTVRSAPDRASSWRETSIPLRSKFWSVQHKLREWVILRESNPKRAFAVKKTVRGTVFRQKGWGL